MSRYDVVIVGGGIVGLATALALIERCPELALAIVEKEASLGAHQTGHNSGVIHSGLYYRPGSVKAATCVAGAALLKAFCREQGIPILACGKVVVATRPEELPRLQQLAERGRANGVEGLRLIGPERLRELEPHAQGLQALHVPGAAAVDFGAVARAMAGLLVRRGGDIRTSTRVTGLIRESGGWVVQTTAGERSCRFLITCAGLHADRLAAMAGGPADVRICPFRGEYFDVLPSRGHLVRSMIYPVPDPAFPFLGVHFTRSVHGGVHAGPNAVLAFKREGYRRRDVSLRDGWELARFPGFWRLTRRTWRVGVAESWRSWCKPAFVRALQRLVPEIRSSDLVPATAGVRAQALDAQGTLLDDFDIQQGPGAIYVRNVPSPAATASLRIGQVIADRAASAWALPTPAERAAG